MAFSRRHCSLWALVGGVFLSALSAPLFGATFSVSNTNDLGGGSFRQALLDANATPGTDLITFQVPGSPPHLIAPKSLLPAVTDPLVVDGTTQPGFTGQPLVQLDGAGAGAGVHGLNLVAGLSTVRGLIITRFNGDGIHVEGGTNIIEGNYIGIGYAGLGDGGNGEGGITLFRSGGNRIGGLTASARNVISGGNLSGIFLIDAGATSNSILGNYIGTDPSGTTRRGNQQNGIAVSQAPGNIIGGYSAAARNVISGNGVSGVYLLGAATRDNKVVGNYIGTSSSGTAALSNGVDGITISAAVSNRVGGPEAGARNVISGNNERGVFILADGRQNLVQGNYLGTDAAGTASLGNLANGVTISGGSSNWIGGNSPTLRNLISGNKLSGLLLLGTNTVANFVQGNYIGVDFSGSAKLSNAANGINISGAVSNWIGGTNSGEGNLLSGNGLAGIFIGATTASGNQIQGNRIGTDKAGQSALGNKTAGVWIESSGNKIGGNSPGARNLLSGNGQSGLYLIGTNATGNRVQGNYIGTDAAGASALGNTYAGVAITNAAANWIGGANPGEGNLISGNVSSGIYLQGTNSTDHRIQGNFIGTDISGSAAVPNGVGGIYFYGAGRNLVGGTNAGAGNLISGNLKVGIAIGDPGANANVVQGNKIGTGADGYSALGSEFHGIEILNTSSNTVVGGLESGAANRIAYAKTVYAGVRVRDGCSRNSVRGNVIFSNGALGLDLGTGGVNTPATPGGWQQFPIITSAVGRYITAVQGTLSGTANKNYSIDFYSSPVSDPSGHGEGFQWLGAANVTANASGLGTFSVQFTNAAPVGRFLSAIATDSTNNSSEFAATVQVTAGPASDLDGDGMSDEFERAAGLNPLSASDALLDADGDGMNNLAEFGAATNPRDPESLLFLEFALPTGGPVSLGFTTVADRHYTVERADAISGSWNPLSTANNLSGTGFPVEFTDPFSSNAEKRFYRVRVSP